MTSPVRALVAVLLVLGGLFAASPGALAALPTSTSVTDPANDQTTYELWGKYPAQRPASDLRKATFGVESGGAVLRLTWAFAGSPTSTRAFQQAGMGTTIGSTALTFTAWKNGSSSYAAVTSGASGSTTKFWCKDRATVAVNATAHTVTMRVPISCLPAGSTATGPYPTSALIVLTTQGVVEGNFASDSQYAAPDFAIR